jgi:23S rRNA pseudouridine2605 synthase
MSYDPEGEPDGVRLQKVLAAAGVGSRRRSDDLIAAGRVTVDGEQAVPGARVDPARAVIRVDGRRIVVRSDRVYLALHKPAGVITAMSDPQGRPTVGDLVAGHTERLFHVGRLDADTEGLLILTNDGDLAQRLSHPSHGATKTYVAEVDGVVGQGVEHRLRAGVVLDDGPASVDHVRVLDASSDRSLIELSIHEGRNRIVRRLLAEVGHPVRRLVRTAVGPVRLGDQRAGTLRDLTADEVGQLLDTTET